MSAGKETEALSFMEEREATDKRETCIRRLTRTEEVEGRNSEEVILASFREHCNTPERVKECCEQNTLVTPQMFDPESPDYDPSLLAIRPEEALNDVKFMSLQPRGENLDHPTVDKYANQARNGVVIEGQNHGKPIFGFRKPLQVVPLLRRDRPGEEIVKIKGGHHRCDAAPKAGITMIPVKLDCQFASLSKHEQVNELMSDNVHPDNGLSNQETDVLGQLAAVLDDVDFMPEERSKIKLLTAKLESPVALSYKDQKSFKNHLKNLVQQVKDKLVEYAMNWTSGRWSELQCKKKVGAVYNNWNAKHVCRINVLSDDELQDRYETRVLETEDPNVLVKRFSGKAGGTKRQLMGDLWKIIVDHYESVGMYPKIELMIQLSSVGSFKNLCKERLGICDYVERLIQHAYPKIELVFLFHGQSRVTGYEEDTNKMYTRDEIDKVYKNLIDNQ